MNARAAPRASATPWLERLTATEIPVFPETRIRVGALLDQGNESMRALAREVVRDPAFTFHVFRESNALVPEGRSVFYEPEHAMSMLGLERVHALVTELPVIPAAAEWAPSYRRLLALSHHAGTQARDWLDARKRPAAYEAQWMASLRIAPLWAACRSDAQLAGKLSAAFARERRTLLARIDRLLGTPFLELSQSLFRHWKLERFMRPLLEHEQRIPNTVLVAVARLGDLPRERRAGAAFPHRALLNENLTFAVFAQALALHAADNWYSRGTLRMERAAAGLLNLGVADALQRIHGRAAQTARSLSAPAGGAPAAQLLDPSPRPHRPLPAAATRNASKPAAVPAPGQADPRTLALRRAIAALRDPRGSASSLPGILRALHDALHRGLGFSRVLLFARSREDLLQLRLHAGLTDLARKGLAVGLPCEGPDLFTRLMQRPAVVHAGGERRIQLVNRLPEAFRNAAKPNAFCAGSLVFRDRPLLLVYADLGARGKEVPESLHQRFRQVLTEARRALAQLEGDRAGS